MVIGDLREIETFTCLTIFPCHNYAGKGFNELIFLLFPGGNLPGLAI